MDTSNIYDAKTRACQLLATAASGEDVIARRNGTARVRIMRREDPWRRIRFGVTKGRLVAAAVFDAPLPGDALAGFEGR